MDNFRQKFSLAADVQAERTNLRLGERLMVALARATVKRFRILVLDEATSAVDQKTGQRIQRTLNPLFSICRVICIAHLLEIIVDYGVILVMGPGGLALEMGPPKTLWEANGVFRFMCNYSSISL